jgi:hypothetical protein
VHRARLLHAAAATEEERRKVEAELAAREAKAAAEKKFLEERLLEVILLGQLSCEVWWAWVEWPVLAIGPRGLLLAGGHPLTLARVLLRREY